MTTAPEARGRGLGAPETTARGTGGGLSWTSPVTHAERRRGDQLPPADPATGRSVCLKHVFILSIVIFRRRVFFAARDGRARLSPAPHLSAAPQEPSPTSGHLTSR